MKTMTDTTLNVLRDRASALIRAEVLAGEQRSQLERAIRDSINKMGRSIENVSEATGVTPAEIKQILARPEPLDDLAVLAGTA